MATQRLGIIMHGVTGRMGMNQHLIRSICAIREGQLDLSSLNAAPGFATGKPGAGISWDAMRSVY